METSLVHEFHTQYNEILSQITLPETILQKYTLLSCLKDSQDRSTYLIQDKSSYTKYILKRTSLSLQNSPTNEAVLMNDLEAVCVASNVPLPKTICSFCDDCFHYQIREYLVGITLTNHVSNYSNTTLPNQEIIHCGLDLCATLMVLHHHTPPIIHRDIKPDNIIAMQSGHYQLIDFGISRYYKNNSTTDTTIAGSQITAAPEQFGYAQTDPRSDIYSLGIVLLYTATGDYNPSLLARATCSNALKRIICKCTNFSPSGRYQSIDAVNQDLRKLEKKKHTYRPLNKCFLIPYTLLVLLIGTGFGFFLSNNIPVASTKTSGETDSPKEIYEFQEPLVEKAVHTTLGIDDSIPITYEDLEKIRFIGIYGEQIFDSFDLVYGNCEYPYINNESYRESGLYQNNGMIESLSDFTHMPNLVELALYNQHITDLSQIKELDLSKFAIGMNDITSLDPLSTQKNLTSLILCDCEYITSMEVLTTLPDLRELNITCTPLLDYSCLSSCKELCKLTISGLSTLLANQIRQSTISKLVAWDLPSDQLYLLDNMKNLVSLFCYGVQTSLPNAPLLGCDQLSKIEFSQYSITSLEFVQTCSSLRDLTIGDSQVTGLDGIDNLPNLLTLHCTQEQKELVNQEIEEPTFSLDIWQ